LRCFDLASSPPELDVEPLSFLVLGLVLVGLEDAWGCLRAAMPPARMIASTLKAGRDPAAWLARAGCCLLLGLPFVLLGLARFCGLEEAEEGLILVGSAAFGSFFTKHKGSSCSGGEAGGQAMGR